MEEEIEIPGIEKGYIKRMNRDDLPDVIRLHIEDMGDSFFASIGERFLQILYGSSLESGLSSGFVFLVDGRIRGFIFGAVDTRALFRKVLSSQFFRLSPLILRHILLHPSSIRVILETFLYGRKTALGEVRAEMLFISIEPRFRKKRVSSALVTEILKDFRRRGVERAKVTAEKDNPGPNLLLQSYGFTLHGVFRFYGKEMNLYYLDLTTSERLGETE